jgi:hypothetical protein
MYQYALLKAETPLCFMLRCVFISLQRIARSSRAAPWVRGVAVEGAVGVRDPQRQLLCALG